MNKNRVYISLFSMVADKKGYIRLFFKLLLLVVYFVFFSVQLFLRFDSSHALQSLEENNFPKNARHKSVSVKDAFCKNDNKKPGNLTYLNKRFHPQDAVTLPTNNFQLQKSFTEIVCKFYTTDEHLINTKINSPSLRGPPFLA